MAPGHMIPMVDMAKLFAQRGVKVTIVTAPNTASLIQKNIDRAIESGYRIKLQLLTLPSTVFTFVGGGRDDAESAIARDMVNNFAKAFAELEQPVEQIIRQHLPSCIVSDFNYPWTADIASELRIPRLVFHGISVFSLCLRDSLIRHAPDQNIPSDKKAFVVPNLPHPIEMKRSELDDKNKLPSEERYMEAELRSYGVIVNSFYELEPDYADHYKETLGRKAWHIGPVSLCNQETVDKSERWNMTSIEKDKCLGWLDSMKPRSVVYVCFGSMYRIKKAQLFEIAMGLESSNHPFIWVVKNSKNANEEEEEWLPEGFEETIKDKGLIIRGWAPQILILDHPAIGGFVTHCGWNSTLEGVAAGVPMITWPLFAEQFHNQKLIVHVAKIGIEIGDLVWSELGEEAVLVKREEVANAVLKLMDGGEEGEEMRKRAKVMGEMAKKAVQEGGSSYVDLGLLIDELITCSAQGTE
eukprot:TRINITY_DN1159_c0_g4_i1.p1 TRINITY_DN1159_c0_g4~~TRINITY_DN1159_c0_g4_i1.p1  ORF type:complete len:516 (-),score=52.31 TRINITY_DN1159_c0_g4_i1:63-1466(-)